jgi:hypothetical protein
MNRLLLSILLVGFLTLCVHINAQSYTCTSGPCVKVSNQGWIVGEIKTFAFGASGKDQMTRELLAQGWIECCGPDGLKGCTI